MSNNRGTGNRGTGNRGTGEGNDNRGNGEGNDNDATSKNTYAVCNGLPCVPKLKNDMWMDLYKYSPPQNLIKGYDTMFQTLNGSGTGEYSVDYYPIWVKRLPKNMNFKTLLNNIRLHIDEIIPDMEFMPECKKSYEEKPLGQIISIVLDKSKPIPTMFGEIGSIPLEKGSVMITKHEDYRWIFTTVRTWPDISHPISGYREFGIACEKNRLYGDRIIIYTRAVNRMTKWSAANLINIILPSWKEYMSDCAKLAWIQFQNGVTEYIKKNGGDAQAFVFNSKQIDFP